VDALLGEDEQDIEGEGGGGDATAALVGPSRVKIGGRRTSPPAPRPSSDPRRRRRRRRRRSRSRRGMMMSSHSSHALMAFPLQQQQQQQKPTFSRRLEGLSVRPDGPDVVEMLFAHAAEAFHGRSHFRVGLVPEERRLVGGRRIVIKEDLVAEEIPVGELPGAQHVDRRGRRKRLQWFRSRGRRRRRMLGFRSSLVVLWFNFSLVGEWCCKREDWLAEEGSLSLKTWSQKIARRRKEKWPSGELLLWAQIVTGQ